MSYRRAAFFLALASFAFPAACSSSGGEDAAANGEPAGSATGGAGGAATGQAGATSGTSGGGNAAAGASGKGGASGAAIGGAAGKGGASGKGGAAGKGGGASGAGASGNGGAAGSAGAIGDDDVSFAKMRASCAFQAGALPKDTFGPSIASLDIPIDTFVVVSQENRSFDHYLSHLPAVGQADVDVAPADAAIPGATGGTVKRFHQTDYCFEDTGHGWNTMHRDWDGGKNDGFAKQNPTTADPTGKRVMGYFDETDIPFYYSLATTFGIADHYFAPTMTQTGPNRLYLYAGTSAGSITNNGAPSAIKQTIFDVLEAHKVSWAVYRPGSYSFEESIFPALLTKYPNNFKSITDYESDCANGTLPHVAFIYAGSDEHPPKDMQKGEVDVMKVYEPLAASPQWKSAAFFLTYDEDGGLYDHVAPPKACKPDDIPPDLQPGDLPGDFAQYGFRVPLLVASAWSKPHFVSHVTSDHTSILRLLELKFDLPALTARDANASPLVEMFDFSKPSFPTAPDVAQAVFDMSKFTSSMCK